MDSWDIETYFANHNVFVNGISNKRASLGAYMTVIDYQNLEKAFVDIPYTKKQLQKFIDYMEAESYLAPTFGLMAKWTAREMEKMN